MSLMYIDPWFKINAFGIKGWDEQAIKTLLDTTFHNPVAAALLNTFKGLPDPKKKLFIVPYDKDDLAENGECNALTHADNPDAAHPPGHKYYLNHEDTDKTKRDDMSDSPGTGGGTDVQIHFNIDKGGTCSKGFLASAPDETLIHEMLHALRDMEGTVDATPTKDTAKDYDTLEEFLAIVVTNIYMSAKYGEDADDKLPADHSMVKALRRPLNTSAGFVNDKLNKLLLDQLAAQERHLFDNVANVDNLRFNPIRALKAKK